MPKVLHLTLHKKWFNQILSGSKKIEYRDIKPYWTTRLFDKNGAPKHFDEIFFRNGYARDCPKMRVEFQGITANKGKYEIRLGKVLSAVSMQKA